MRAALAMGRPYRVVSILFVGAARVAARLICTAKLVGYLLYYIITDYFKKSIIMKGIKREE